MTIDRSTHGWWPYVTPQCVFLLLIELSNRTPESLEVAMLVAKGAVPLALVAWFWLRGAYPELRGIRERLSGLPLDFLFGAFTGALWMAPYIAVPALRPESLEGFDPSFAGAEYATAMLGLRMFGYAVSTPVFEEIFMRAFVMRVAEVWGSDRDFRDVPIAYYTQQSFLVTCGVFVLTHWGWEVPSAIVWIALTNLWFYRRRHLSHVIALHAGANAFILVAAIALDGVFPDGSGGRLTLWFFV